MLVLSRKVGEKIFVGNNIIVTVLRIERGQIRLGIDAPSDISILRDEIAPMSVVNQVQSATTRARCDR